MRGENFLKSVRVGDLVIPNNIWLAPMAGVTDLAFRKMCKEQGAGLVECEMVSSKAIVYGDEKTRKMLNTERRKKTCLNADIWK